jgi:peptide/nickel transport system permease protein
MQRYILQRLILSIPVIFLVVLLVFLLVHALPGDVVESRVAGSGLTREQIEAYRRDLGLDRPLHEQFLEWLGGLGRGDLGTSLFTGRSVRDDLAERAPATIELGILALILAMLIAVPLGVISAIRPNSSADYVARVTAILGLAIPDFFLGVLAILVLSRWLGFFPRIGYVSLFDDPVENLRRMWLPVLIVGVRQSAAIARMVRSSLLEILRSDYIRTAWAKGLRERTVVVRHAVKNALIPVITILGLQVSAIIGGVVIIETLFTIPGMGEMMVLAAFRRDLVPLQAIVLIFALIVVVVNLIVDISYSWLDPRIRYQ